MTVDDCYQLGYIVKPHGLKGQVQILLDVDYPEVYQDLESVFVQQGQQLVPFFIDTISLNGEKGIVSFEDISSFELAQTLKGCPLFLPLDNLPALDDDDFYYHELVGMKLLDTETGQKLGMVENVLEAGAQTLLSIKHESEREILIPLIDELIEKVDKENGAIHMHIPEGLIDVYLNDEL